MESVAREKNTTLQIADQYLQVEEVRLRYRDEGAGPALLLVHGWTLDLEMWDPQVAGLRDAFRSACAWTAEALALLGGTSRRSSAMPRI